MARFVCSSCGRTLSRIDFVRRRAHRTDQGFYCDECFSGMLSDVSEGESSASKEIEEDVDLLEALEDSLPEAGMPQVDEGPVDPGAQTVSAPAPESYQASASTIRDVRREFIGDGGDESADQVSPPVKPPPQKPQPAAKRKGRKRRDVPAPKAPPSGTPYIVAALLTLAMLVLAYIILTWRA